MKNLYNTLGISPVTPQPSEFVNLKDYQEYLIRTHLGLVEYLDAKLFLRFPNNRLCEGDLASVGYEALLYAARAYKPSDKAFLPYAYKTIEFAMFKEIRELFPVDLKTSYKSEKGFNYMEIFSDQSFDTFDVQHYNSWDDEEQLQRESLDNALERLSSEERSLIEDHFGFHGKALTFKEMGEQHKVSLQAVNKKEKRILKLLHDDLKRCA